MRKRLVFRADDVGYTETFDLGAYEAFEKGYATSADVMLDSPHTVEALKWLRERPWISIGWHRHLWESPILGKDEIPHMVDDEGRFVWRHRKQYLMNEVPYEEAYKEFKEVILPETFTSPEGMTLTIVAICDFAFDKCRSIKKVDLPKTIKIIGENAFGNTDVNDLSLKEGVVKIGSKAFLNNDLKDIHIPDGVEEIGAEAFYCLKSTIFQRNAGGTLYIPKSVYSIGDHAFAMTRNGYGAWFNSKREILCLPDYITLDNCKKMGISREPVEKYLNKK